MKKILSRIMVFVLLITVLSTSLCFAAENITVYVDNSQVYFDVQPRLIGGRTMVPLRAIFEALGATVEWDDATETVTAYNEAYIVKATIDVNVMTVNGQEKVMDISPMLVDSRTLVPARFVAEAFDCQVDWDGNRKRVDITTKAIDYNKLEQGSNNGYVNPGSNTSTSGVIELNKYSFDPVRQIKVSCVNFIRGSAANTLVESENQFNDDPTSSQEWVFMEFDLEYISSSDGNNDVMEASDILFRDDFFTGSKSTLTVHDTATLSHEYEGHGIFDIELYPGSSATVALGLLIDKSVSDILLRVPYDNGDKFNWISCNPSTSTNNGYTGDFANHPSVKTYTGTTIPTYTSVTGYPLLRTTTLDSGSKVYIYEYSNSEDVGDYWRRLSAEGWTLNGEDDPTTPDTFESTLINGSKYIIIHIALSLNEVWITFN